MINTIDQYLELENGSIKANPDYNARKVKNSVKLEELKERQKKMKEMKEQGKTLHEIGKEFNLSRQRVHQIINQPYNKLN